MATTRSPRLAKRRAATPLGGFLPDVLRLFAVPQGSRGDRGRGGGDDARAPSSFLPRGPRFAAQPLWPLPLALSPADDIG